MTLRDAVEDQGDRALKTLTLPSWTTSRIVRWCAAQQNWHKVHFDRDFARQVDALPDLIVNGALKQHLLVQFVYEAFDGLAWPWRLDYRFHELDLVGDRLEVRGKIVHRESHGPLSYVHVKADIWNVNRGRPTTMAHCVAIVDPTGMPVIAAPIGAYPPMHLQLQDRVDDDENVFPAAAEWMGMTLEDVTSYVPVERSRLRLFADALGCIRPIHYDPAAAEEGPFGVVTAPPLYPIHGVERRPGDLLLSDSADADGSESSGEMGRHLPFASELPFKATLNGGNSVEIHNLARLGDTIHASSRLVGARQRIGRQSGAMLILEVLNRYETSSGRPLLTEKQTLVKR